MADDIAKTKTAMVIDVLERQKTQFMKAKDEVVALREKKLLELAELDAQINDLNTVIVGIQPSIRFLKDHGHAG